MSYHDPLPNLLAKLRAERDRQGLRQSDIAERMGTTQDVVSEIERNVNDIHLSTLQNYHRAVTGKRLRITLSRPVDLDPGTPTDFAISA